MNEIDPSALTEMPREIASIGVALSRAIHAEHRRRVVRHSRLRRAVIVLAAIGIGSGTAFAAQLGVQPAYFVNTCLRQAVSAPQGTYTSLQELMQACGLPYTAPSTTPPTPPPPPTLPNASTTAATASRSRPTRLANPETRRPSLAARVRH